jgi:hypothetical protein
MQFPMRIQLFTQMRIWILQEGFQRSGRIAVLQTKQKKENSQKRDIVNKKDAVT